MRYFFFITFLFYSSSIFAIDTKANEAIVIDYNTNEVLFEKNSDSKISPASLTKIMTVYVVFDRINNSSLTTQDNCTVSSKAYKIGGSRMFLEIDKKVSIEDLLRGIIIQSGNDASIAIAECLSGTENDFAILMNQYARELGMLNTNFTNASGWPEENHFSTVRDIGILSNNLIKNFPESYNYFNETTFTYNEIKQPNRNKLLSHVDGSDGLKTGYTKDSGWGIAGSSLRNERRITVVISGTNSSRSRLNESSNLINWAFRETTEKQILKKNQVIKTIDTWLGNKSNVDMIVKENFNTIVSFDQIKLIKSSIEYQNPLPAPIEKGQEIGKIIILIPGKDKISIPLVSNKDVKLINPLFRFFAAAKYLIFGNTLND